MNEVEKKQYLRNVLSVAHADKVLTPEESDHIEAVRVAIGATKTQLRAASKEIDHHSLDLTPLQRLSTRIRNVEDMIEVAVADGSIGEAEKSLLLGAAKRVGISQSQVDTILTEAKERRRVVLGRCRACGAGVDANAKFCPECGTSLAARSESGGIATELTIPSAGITVAFAESTAAGFAEGLELAKQSCAFQQAVKRKKRWFAATYSPNNIGPAIALADKLSGMRNREVYVDGEKVEWDSVFGFARCCSLRERAYRPVEYCFGIEEDRLNVWGCKLLDMDWTNWADWLTYGRFISAETFQFDRKRIAHELRNRLEKARFCPHLRVRFITSVLRNFPERVNVREGGEWEYRETYEPSARAIKVKLAQDYAGFQEPREVQVDGVRPRDAELAKRLIMKAAEECGITDVEYRALPSAPTGHA